MSEFEATALALFVVLGLVIAIGSAGAIVLISFYRPLRTLGKYRPALTCLGVAGLALFAIALHLQASRQ